MDLSKVSIELLNEIINTDRSNLGENTTNLIQKLKNERDKLHETFLVNLPVYYNDENKFNLLYNDINELNEKLSNLKMQNIQIKSQIELYKNENKTETQHQLDVKLKPLIVKSFYIERYMSYLACLSEMNEFKDILEGNLSQLKMLQKTLSVKETDVERQQQKLNDYNRSIQDTISVYLDLVQKYESIHETKCSNLNDYIFNLIKYFHLNIRTVLVNELDDVLKLISYPFIKTDQQHQQQQQKKPLTAQQSQTQANDQQTSESLNNAKLVKCVVNLIRIELPKFYQTIEKLKSTKTASYQNHHQLEQQHRPAVPFIINLLTKPFQKRFKYHFYGNKKTNNLDRPEWYLTQIIQWIKDHEIFLQNTIQPIFDRNDFKVMAIIEFTRSLVELINEKFDYDFIKHLQNNEIQFSHTIDELLVFDQQLKKYLNSILINQQCHASRRSLVECDQQLANMSSLFILCDNETIFSHWLQLEYTVCLKKVDLMFASNNNKSEIWVCNFADVDELKPPHCTESFMLLIKTISDRYKNLPYASKKLSFLMLQLDLISDYRLRLCQIQRDEANDPLSKINFGILNAINYILYIIDEWKNSPFYIEMQCIKMKYLQFLKKFQLDALDGNLMGKVSSEQACGDDDENGDRKANYTYEYTFQLELRPELCKVFDLQMKNVSSEFNEFIEINGTVFDDLLPSYEKVNDDMVHMIVSNCMWQIKSRSRNYRKEKWMLMPSFKEYCKPSLTQSAADMLISLRNLLHLLQDSLAKKLFNVILKRLTIELDRFFYEDILLKTQFNDGGSAQFDYDITKYLLPILYEFTNDTAKIDLFFRKTKEALILIQLPQGTALLLKETLYKSLHHHFDDDSSKHQANKAKETKALMTHTAKNALKEFGIVQLTSEQAELVLSLRIYL